MSAESKSSRSQGIVAKFKAALSSKIGVIRSGNPESKKVLRQFVCPQCTMQTVGNDVGCTFSSQHPFPCICMEKSQNGVEANCQQDKIHCILSEMTKRNCSCFDIKCICDEGHGEQVKIVSIKLLQRNTWDRNNQPTSDNMRITAVKNAFITIGTPSCGGSIELHVIGPNMVKTRPYARLGVGITMVSGKAWIPGLMYMVSKSEKQPIDFTLDFKLKYPPNFQGKISIQFFKKNAQSDAIQLFNINTRSRKLSLNTLERHDEEDVDCNRSTDTDVPMSDNDCRYSNNWIDSESLTTNASDNNSDQTSVDTKFSAVTELDNSLNSSLSPHCDDYVENRTDLVRSEFIDCPFINFHAIGHPSPFIAKLHLDFLQSIIYSQKFIEMDDLKNFQQFGSRYEKNWWRLIVFKPNTFNGSCLHSIAQNQRLNFYKYLEQVFGPKDVLTQFCTSTTPSNNKVPFQLACASSKDALCDYIIDAICNSTSCVVFKRLLQHSDWYGQSVLQDIIYFEKVTILEKIIANLNLYPELLSKRDFSKASLNGNSIRKVMEANGVFCALENTMCLNKDDRNKHQKSCKAVIVKPLLIKILQKLERHGDINT